MTKSIGSVVFSERIEVQIQWLNRAQFQAVGHAQRYALSGDVHATQRYRGGRVITLTAQPPWCRLTKATVDALLALADVPGGQYTFTWGSATYTVLFYHGAGPAVNMQPMTGHETEPEWAGTINLIEV